MNLVYRQRVAHFGHFGVVVPGELLVERAVIDEDMAQGLVVEEVAVAVQVVAGKAHHTVDRVPERRLAQKHQVPPDHHERSVEVVLAHQQQDLSLLKHGR